MAKRLRVLYLSNTMTPRLDAKGEPITPSLYPPSANPCPHCPARCCTHRVEVSIPDAVRLATMLALPFETAFELVPDGMRPFELGTGPACVVLRRTKRDRHCRFLGRYDDELRCGIYGARPATCRLYPYTFEVGDIRLGPRHIRCPVPFGMPAAAERPMKAEARRAGADWALHETIAKAWKRSRRKDRSLPGFLRFAIPRVHEANGEGHADPKDSPLLWPTGSQNRGVQMMLDHGVLRS